MASACEQGSGDACSIRDDANDNSILDLRLRNSKTGEGWARSTQGRGKGMSKAL